MDVKEKFTTPDDYREAVRLFKAFYDVSKATCDYDHDSAMEAASDAVKEITGLEDFSRLVAGFNL